MVVAVPLFPARERQRGYNQSVLLADEALRWLRRERPDWRLTEAHGAMERRRSTESSFVLSRAGRRRNMRGAFKVLDDVVGREVLLVDDILTSGATARECARVLMAAGAAKVWVATLARAQKRHVKSQHEDAGELVAKWDMAAGTLEGR
jgi:ComF family protein